MSVTATTILKLAIIYTPTVFEANQTYITHVHVIVIVTHVIVIVTTNDLDPVQIVKIQVSLSIGDARDQPTAVAPVG